MAARSVLDGSCETALCLDKFTWLFGRALNGNKDTESVSVQDMLIFHPC